MENINKNNALIDFDLSGLIEKYRKKWYLFLISVIVCGFLAGAYAMIKKTLFSVRADILIAQESKDGGLQTALLQNSSFGSLLGVGGNVDDEINLVSAHSTLREVAKRLGLNKTHVLRHSFFNKEDLYQEYPIEIYAAPMTEDTLSKTLQFKVRISETGDIVVRVNKGFKKLTTVKGSDFPLVVNTEYGDFILNPTPYYVAGEKLATNITIKGYDKTAEDIDKHTFISIPEKKSNLIHLEVEESNVDRGKDLLNTIIETYNQRGIDEQNREGDLKAQFIDERIALVVQELAESEREVEEYKKANNLTNIEVEAQIILEQSTELSQKRIDLEAQREMVDIIEEFLQNDKNNFTLIPFNSSMSDPSSASAIQQYNDLLLKRMEISFSAKESNRSLQILDEQIEATRKNVLSTLSGIKESLDISQEILGQQEEKFNKRISDMPTQEREYIDIERLQIVKENLFVFLLQKREENALTQSMATPKSTIVNEAYHITKPISTPKIIILFIGILFGLVLPPIYLYIKDLVRTKFSTRSDLEALTSIPLLGEISAHKTKEHIVIREGENTPIAELFRLIRNNIQFILNKQGAKVLLVTSSISGEGKSFVGSNLAISLALLGKRVLLIGMDIRHPQLGKKLGLQIDSKGLTHYLADPEVTVEEITLPNALQEKMDIILAGPVPPNPSELLLSDRVDELFSCLREKYDYILIDSAPISGVVDTFSLNRIADATLFVCRADYTPKECIRFLNRITAEKRLGKLFLILNGTEARQGYGSDKE